MICKCVIDGYQDTVWYIKLLNNLLPSLVTIVLGGYVLQRFFVRRSNEAVIIDFLITEFDRLQMDSMDYWNCTAEKPQCDQLLSQRIKGRIRSSYSLLNWYTERYDVKNSNYLLLMVEVTDSCSGGNFESKNRTPDSSRYLKIFNSITKIKIELLQRKI